MRPLNYLELSAANIANDQFGVGVVADFMYAALAQAVITGSSPNGTLKLQASNDLVFSPLTPVNWSDIGTPLAVTTAGIYLLPYIEICYAFIRVVWLKNTGTGAITARIKTVGY